MASFLLELGVEEIPAGYILRALQSLAEKLEEKLSGADLAGSPVLATGTPRRLVLYCDGVRERQPDREEVVTGPPAGVARDEDGNWTKAALGFARSQGVEPDALFIVEAKKGRYAAARKFRPGRPATEVLAECLPEVVRAARFPKSMRWTAERVAFARPVRRIVALLDREIVPFEFAGVKSGRESRGHPFLAPERFELESADFEKYKQLLRERFVVVDFEERRAKLAEGIEKRASENSWKIFHEGLLDEVTNLLEVPNILVGSFEERYLDLPEEVLVEAMTSHQRYFPVRDGATGRLVPKFLTGYNRLPEHEAAVREGNERVLEARLADAEFFYATDRKKRLADRLQALEHVVYQEKLGTYREKAERMEALAGVLACAIGLSDGQAEAARRAALLAKADLVTEMVGEFPKLEGTMGRIYALADGEGEDVARGIGEHYLPRASDDPVPATSAGVVAALADKLDALSGCFWARLEPTGSADPYALRRAAQGVIRIVTERAITLPLAEALSSAAEPFEADAKARGALVGRVLEFIRERFYNMMIERGRKYDIVRAVLAVGGDDLLRTVKRLEAVSALAEREDWPQLVTVVERAHNITKGIVPSGVDEGLLVEPSEKDLHGRWMQVRPRVLELIEREDYVAASVLFSDSLARPLHDFFDQVFVNVEDAALRANRLSLIADIRDAYESHIAVLTEIQSDDAAKGIPGKTGISSGS